MSKLGFRICGSLLTVIGLFMIFRSATVTDFGFYRFGRVSTGGILVVLFAIALVAAFLKPNALTKALVLVVLILMVVSILLVMNISFYGITLADVLLMIIPIALGIGFLLKAQLMKE